MKKKLIRAAAALIVLAMIIAIAPYQCGLVLKDGGSKHWEALTWEVHHYHRMKPVGGDNDGWFEGWRIKVFGHTLRDDYKDTYGHD